MITLQQYITENNLPDFLENWEQVADIQGVDIADLLQEVGITPAPKTPPAPPAAPAAPVVPAPTPKTPKTPAAAAPAAAANVEAAILALVSQLQPQQAPIDEERIIELIKEYSPIKTIEIKVNNNPTVQQTAIQHYMFEKTLRLMAAKRNGKYINLFLYGPAGTGKTNMAESCAKALGKKFSCISVCSQSTQSNLLGYMSANGQYISTLFREAYENGGVFLLDEIDNGNPNVLAVLNSALANGYCAFPDGMIKRHEEFQCIAAANTFGTGADRQYVGRNQLDAATLNRFMQIEIDYCEALEIALFGEVAKDIQVIRKKLKGERAIVSMRNIENTLIAEAGGFSRKEAIQLAVIDTIPQNLRSKIA